MCSKKDKRRERGREGEEGRERGWKRKKGKEKEKQKEQEWERERDRMKSRKRMEEREWEMTRIWRMREGEIEKDMEWKAEDIGAIHSTFRWWPDRGSTHRSTTEDSSRRSRRPCPLVYLDTVDRSRGSNSGHPTYHTSQGGLDTTHGQRE